MTVLINDLSKNELRAEGRRLRVVSEEVGFTIIQFSLPAFPVPLSSCFNNYGKRRIESERYTAWKLETDHYLAKKRIPKIKGAVVVTFTVRKPDRRKRDLDNLNKCLCDSLTRNHILNDDSDIVDLRIKWATVEVFEGTVFVEITKVAA